MNLDNNSDNPFIHPHKDAFKNSTNSKVVSLALGAVVTLGLSIYLGLNADTFINLYSGSFASSNTYNANSIYEHKWNQTESLPEKLTNIKSINLSSNYNQNTYIYTFGLNSSKKLTAYRGLIEGTSNKIKWWSPMELPINMDIIPYGIVKYQAQTQYYIHLIGLDKKTNKTIIYTYNPNITDENNWQNSITLDIPSGLKNYKSTIIRDNFYLIGGEDDEKEYSLVYKSKINFNGLITTPELIKSLPVALSKFGLATYNNDIFIIGGTSLGNTQNKIYYAEALEDGSIDKWNSTISLPENIHSPNIFINNSRIDVVGGIDDSDKTTNNSYSSELSTKGISTSWIKTTHLEDSLKDSGVLTFLGYAYLIGGASNDSVKTNVYYKQIPTKDYLSSWNSGITIKDNYLQNIITRSYKNTIYIFANILYPHNSIGNAIIYYTKVGVDGKITNVNPTSSPLGKDVDKIIINDAFIYNDKAYVVALNGEIYSATITENGITDSWSYITSVPTTACNCGTFHTYLYNNTLYLLGQGGSNGLTEVYYTHLDKIPFQDGWNKTGSPSAFLFNYTSTLYNNSLYIFGGSDPADGTKVYYAKLGTNGIEEKWKQSTSLPISIGGSTTFNYNDKIYILGGSNTQDIDNSIYLSNLSDNGIVGNWNTISKLPIPFNLNTNSIVLNKRLYLLSGSIIGENRDNLTQNQFYSLNLE